MRVASGPQAEQLDGKSKTATTPQNSADRSCQYTSKAVDSAHTASASDVVSGILARQVPVLPR